MDKAKSHHYSWRMASERQKAEAILGKSVNDFISRELRTGSSWKDVASNLYLATAGECDVTVSTLKHWSNTPKKPLAI